jgi:hypothetical protein
MPFAPNQSLAGCIMNIPSRLPARDRVFADNRGSPWTNSRMAAGLKPLAARFPHRCRIPR